MSILPRCRLHRFTALAILFTGFGLGYTSAASANQPDGREAVQELTRGPVHEAFAETVTFDPEPGIVVDQSPPAAIHEIPPDQRPEGADVAWIPGYWAWDDEREDFLWVSGIWRDLPPDRQWVPGYWNKADAQFQWISGYWADAKATEIEYLPEPPATIEEGPNTTAASDDQIWMPGSWVWHQSRYAWRPGYWATAQPDWVWVPAYYTWAPRGYVFVDGYWDYSVARRGLLFAPVYFNSRVYTRQNYSYSPTTVINPAVFASHLFLRPSYGHYYFGDYYGVNYSNTGFYPRFSYHSHQGYDPFYAHQRWHNRQDRDWERGVKDDFQHRRDHEDARPPSTWDAQRERTRQEGSSDSKEKSFVVTAPLEQLAESKNSPIRFQSVDKQEQERLATRSRAIDNFRQERQKLESTPLVSTRPDDPDRLKSARVKLPTSPLLAKKSDPSNKVYAPPKSLEAPETDNKFEPKPRKSRELPGSHKNDSNVTKRDSIPEPSKDKPTVIKPRPRTDSLPNKPDVKKDGTTHDPAADEPKRTTGRSTREPSEENPTPVKRIPRADSPETKPKVAPRKPESTKKPEPTNKPESKQAPKRDSKQPPRDRAPSAPQTNPKAGANDKPPSGSNTPPKK